MKSVTAPVLFEGGLSGGDEFDAADPRAEAGGGIPSGRPGRTTDPLRTIPGPRPGRVDYPGRRRPAAALRRAN